MSLEPRSGHNVVPHLPQPPRRMHAETVYHFEAAISAGDWAAFDNYLSNFGPDKALGINDLYPVVFQAVIYDSATAIERLLCHGLTMRHNFVLEAIRARAKRSLDVMVKSWDMNEPISETEPTVLAYAVGDEEMTLYLLDHGADLNKQTYINLTPMSYAVQVAPPELIKTLLDRGGDVQNGELLHHALDRPTDTMEVLRILIDRGAPLNANMYENHEASRRLYPFVDFGTPLHKAAGMGNADIVRFLLERKADPTIKSTKGRTVMEWAMESGSAETVELLQLVSADHI
ncbi:hypothetical protein Daus18300_012901 [Diaporthe australafricana]|uniref:Ankyrin repeat protein n=1 Tax=Diaporthe australafricana TaxID=127596 RepID=A0ABR3W114_9PEZI